MQRKYLSFAYSNVPFLSTEFFPAEYATKEMSKTIPVLIGLGSTGLGIYEMPANGKPSLEVFHKYTDLESCEVKPSATSSSKKRMSIVKSGTSVSSSSNNAVMKSVRNLAIDEQITPGPIKFLLIVSTNRKAMKEIRFQVSTFLQNDSNLVNFINKYQESYDYFVENLRAKESSELMVTVQLVDGTLAKKMIITPEMTVQDLIFSFCNKIGVKDTSFFQIAVLEDGLCITTI